MNEQLAASYRHCRQATRGASSNFGFTFLLLPAEERRAMCALYAFLRHTDDLADGPAPRDEKRTALAQWRGQLTAALAGDYEHPLFAALADTAARYAIPPEHLYAPIEGALVDLDKTRYASFAELADYCDLVASSVGLACLHIWGFEQDASLEPAMACGRALQLTNILRDLREDAARGRIYLPQEDLRQFSIDEDELLAGRAAARLAPLVRFEIERAEGLYDQASELWPALSPRGRRIYSAMFGTYRALLAEMARRPDSVWDRPATVSPGRKCWLAATALLGRPPAGYRAHLPARRNGPGEQAAATSGSSLR